MITIYIDENFAPQIAESLRVIQSHLNKKDKDQFEVKSIPKVFGWGVKDEDWIPIAGKEKAVVITQDLRIQTTRHQRDLYEKFDLGIFFFKPPSKKGYTFWKMYYQLVKRWDDIKKLSAKSSRPFSYKCTSNKNKFEKID